MIFPISAFPFRSWAGILAICGGTFAGLCAQTSDYVVTRYAGAEHTNIDGPLASARFDRPAGVALDRHGNLFVADSGNHTVRIITPAGMVATLAGSPGRSGTQDGIGSEARLNAPERLAVDLDGNLHVATSLGRTVQKITPEGLVTTVVGEPELADAHLYGLAVDSARNLYFALEWPGTVRKKTAAGVTTTIAGNAVFKGQNEIGTVFAESLFQPRTIATDASDNLYVINDVYEIVRLSAAGVGTRIRITSGPWVFQPEGMAIGPTGDIFITNTFGHTIVKVTTAGVATTFVGGTQGYRDGVGTAARLTEPRGMAITADGTLFVAQGYSDSILKITTAAEVTTLAGTVYRVQNGAAEIATFRIPWALALDASGNLFVSDLFQSVVRKIDSNRWVSTIADGASQSGAVDAIGAAASFGRLSGMVADTGGNLFVTDETSGTIRKITSSGVVTTIAGLAGTRQVVDGTNAVARFQAPSAIAIDGVGNLYVADSGTIRKIAPTGDVTNLAGKADQYGAVDATGTAARFSVSGITGLAINNQGTLYAVDRGANAIRQITPSGVVTTFAGQLNVPGQTDGQGSNAKFVSPQSIVLDTAGNLYVGEAGRVRKVTPAGMVTTLWSGWTAGGPAFHGIAIDPAGVLYLTATGCVLRLAIAGPAIIATQPSSRSIAAGASLTMAMSAAGSPAPMVQWQRNGRDIVNATTATLNVANVQPADTGLYRAIARNGATDAISHVAIVGVTTPNKVIGSGRELDPHNIRHPNGNVFDQVLLEGAAAAITADHSRDPTLNQITRLSYIDLDDDIVQVEFSGPGTLSIVLENPSGPTVPTKYNQATTYMKGHAGIVIAGATERTNVSVFSVGRRTAVNQALFKDDISYDGIADIAYIAIVSANGRFGGVRTANASYYATHGLTGLYAPGVVFEGPVFIGNLSAFDHATPVIQVAAASDVRITGGDLSQANSAAVQVEGFQTLQFAAGTDSHGNGLPAQPNRAVLMKHRADVTAQLINGSD